MAFNFSKIEMSHFSTQRKAPLQAKPEAKPDAPSAARA
jgi:hypothetical protein